MKRILLLGATGSIGQNALAVIRAHPKCFAAVGLSTHANVELLRRQAKEFGPAAVCVTDPLAAKGAGRTLAGCKAKVFVGQEGMRAFLRQSKADVVLLAISGSAALEPLVESIEAGKDIAMANKEALVMAGPLLMRRAREKKVTIIPVDSEQSAIWQCLAAGQRPALKTIYLTASGGPLWQASLPRIKRVTVREVIRHPRWKMGRKISVDSATMMNKGLEVLEAMFLFGVGAQTIKVVIHPEAIIHSMVEFIDGVIIAQLSVTDMRIPIQYAFSYPLRQPGMLAGLDVCGLGALHFSRPDLKRFPCLTLAYEAARQLGTMPAVLNAANEVAVEAFLSGRIAFVAIPRIIERLMQKHRVHREPSLHDIMHADQWARQHAQAYLGACKHANMLKPI